MSIGKSRVDFAGGDMDWMRGKVLLKPDDQLNTEILSVSNCM